MIDFGRQVGWGPFLGIEEECSEVNPSPKTTPFGIIVAIYCSGVAETQWGTPWGVLVHTQFSELIGCPTLANGQPLAVRTWPFVGGGHPVFPKLGEVCKRASLKG